jgi:hypothetical protein
MLTRVKTGGKEAVSVLLEATAPNKNIHVVGVGLFPRFLSVTSLAYGGGYSNRLKLEFNSDRINEVFPKYAMYVIVPRLMYEFSLYIAT